MLLANVTQEQLRAADIIVAMDPRQPSSQQQVWGQGVVPAVIPYPADAHTMQVVEIDIVRGQDGQFQELLSRVESAKGCLHPEVQSLKK